MKRLVLAPLNEWGEGSYAEPNAEFGFGFYESVRETFFPEPAGGYPLNVTPKDVGLGPYDLPALEAPKRVTAWDFTAGAAGEWRPLMGVEPCEPVAGKGLVLKTTTDDPAIVCGMEPVAARAFKTVVVRMRVEQASGSAQLFWAGPGATAREAASCRLPLATDDAFHDYRFPVSGNRLWRGRINHFRFDPCGSTGAKVTIESIRLEKQETK